jgi:perosamine synthetase
MSPDRKYWHSEVGYNYRMTNLQAALGVGQLERITSLLSKKTLIFNWYQEFLSELPFLKLNYQAVNTRNVYWMVCMEVVGYSRLERDNLILRLKEHGIETRPFFYPLSSMPMFTDSFNPIAQLASERGLNLPSYFDLGRDQVFFICQTIKELLSSHPFISEPLLSLAE